MSSLKKVIKMKTNSTLADYRKKFRKNVKQFASDLGTFVCVDDNDYPIKNRGKRK